ncbi:MAG TPA: hypothetical protein VK957_13525, partial [Lunatimonas sp.]|nr:hypothetical protein [Lunatimonas sp.]
TTEMFLFYLGLRSATPQATGYSPLGLKKSQLKKIPKSRDKFCANPRDLRATIHQEHKDH